MLSSNVSISILEHEDGGLVDLESDVRREGDGVRVGRGCWEGG